MLLELEARLQITQEVYAARLSALQVTSHLDPKFGGISGMLPRFCWALERAGVWSAPLAGFCGEDEKVPADALRLKPGRLGWMLDGRRNKALQAALADVDVAHIHGIWQEHCEATAAECRRSAKPYVVAAHGMLERWALANKGWKKRLYLSLVENRNLRGAACLHALTADEAEDYRAIGCTQPVAIIPNGVELPEHLSADPFLRKFPALRGKRIVLFLGRIHYKKGLDILVKAWKRICDADAQAQLVIAGPDFENTEQQIRKLVAESGLERRVTFTGLLDRTDKWSALTAASVFVLPSYSEGFSVSVLEALAAGCPVVVSKQCHFPEIQTRGCGVVIEPKQGELEQTLEFLLASETSRMSANGRALVAEKYSWEIVGAKMAELYRWCAGGPEPKLAEVV